MREFGEVLVGPLVQLGAFDHGDVGAEGAVVPAALEADEDALGHAHPLGVGLSAVETHVVAVDAE